MSYAVKEIFAPSRWRTKCQGGLPHFVVSPAVTFGRDVKATAHEHSVDSATLISLGWMAPVADI